MIRRLLGLVLAFAWGVAANADAPYTRLLLPIYAGAVPGALDTRWAVDGWVVHGGTGEAQIIPRPLCGVILCPLSATLQPNEGPLPIDPILTDAKAVLVHIDSPHAHAVRMTMRVRDLTRQRASAGTELPVIPESDFFDGPMQLQNVPVDTRFRTALRIYALPETDEPEVEVRYYRMPAADPYSPAVTLLRTDRVRLQTFAPIGGYALQPSIAMLGNVQALPEIASEDAIWMNIVPLTPGLRIWAFVSVTNNETQEVTLVSP